MRRQVDMNVRKGHRCQRAKTLRHATFGVLRALLLPARPSGDISMDLVVGLPECQGFDAVWVVVDRFSKIRYCIPCQATIDQKGVAKLFVREVVRLPGWPKTIVADLGPQYTSNIWGLICSRLGSDRRMSTAFHPPTAGHTVPRNGGIEQYLRVFVNHQQDVWV